MTKRVAAGLGWLAAALVTAAPMLMWMIVLLNGLGSATTSFQNDCNSQLRESDGAAASAEMHLWSWDCFGSSGELLYRSWLPPIGWTLALVPPGVFVGIVLYLARWRRASSPRYRPIRELLHLVGWVGVGVASAGAAVVGMQAAGALPPRSWSQTLGWVLLMGGWFGWGRALRRAFAPKPAVITPLEAPPAGMTVEQTQ